MTKRQAQQDRLRQLVSEMVLAEAGPGGRPGAKSGGKWGLLIRSLRSALRAAEKIGSFEARQIASSLGNLLQSAERFSNSGV